MGYQIIWISSLLIYWRKLSGLLLELLNLSIYINLEYTIMLHNKNNTQIIIDNS